MPRAKLTEKEKARKRELATIRRHEWNTKDEKKFIDHLSAYSTGVLISRLLLLKKYLASMDLRARWDGINQYELRDYVKVAIKTEEMSL